MLILNYIFTNTHQHFHQHVISCEYVVKSHDVPTKVTHDSRR